MKRNLLLILLISLAVVGCKVELNPIINVSSLSQVVGGGPEGQFLSTIKIDAPVSMCKQTETGLDHKTLLEAKQNFSYIFPDSTYSGCVKSKPFTKITDSAIFYVKGGDNLKTSIKFSKSFSTVLFNIDQTVLERARKISSSGMMSEPEVSICVTLKNDTPQNFKFDLLYPVFIKDKNGELNPEGTTKFILFLDDEISFVLNDVSAAIFKKEMGIALFQF